MGKSSAVIVDKLLCDDAELADYIKCTLPEVKWKTASLSGGGIAGNVELPLQGMPEAMNFTVDLRALGKENLPVIMRPGIRSLELRFNRNVITSSGRLIKAGTKIYLSVMSAGVTPGGVERGAAMEGSAPFAVLRYRWVEDGEELLLIDQLNQIYHVGGADYSDMYRL